MANALEPRVAALEIQVQEVSARLDKLEARPAQDTDQKINYILDAIVDEHYNSILNMKSIEEHRTSSPTNKHETR